MQSLNPLWNRRQSTKFNGVSYPVQRAAEAIYTEQGKIEVRNVINFYMENASIMKQRLTEMGFKVYGGVNAPYVWLKTKNNLKSWDFFDKLLKEVNIHSSRVLWQYLNKSQHSQGQNDKQSNHLQFSLDIWRIENQ